MRAPTRAVRLANCIACSGVAPFTSPLKLVMFWMLAGVPMGLVRAFSERTGTDGRGAIYDAGTSALAAIGVRPGELSPAELRSLVEPLE